MPVLARERALVSASALARGLVPAWALVSARESALVSASALNWPGAGYTRANASVVAISTGREVKVYNGSGSPTDVLIDVNGYFR